MAPLRDRWVTLRTIRQREGQMALLSWVPAQRPTMGSFASPAAH